MLQRIGDLKRSIERQPGRARRVRGSAWPSPAASPTQGTGTPTRERELALNLTKIGAREARAGRCRDGALAALEESLAIRRALPQTDLTKWQIDVAENLETIGDLKLAAGDKDGALALYEEMLVARPHHGGQATPPTPNGSATCRSASTGSATASSRSATRPARSSTTRRASPSAANWPRPTRRCQRQQDVALNLERIGDLKRGAGDNRRRAQGL